MAALTIYKKGSDLQQASLTHATPMQYGLDATIYHLWSEVSECSAQIQELSAIVEQAQELNTIKDKLRKQGVM